MRDVTEDSLLRRIVVQPDQADLRYRYALAIQGKDEDRAELILTQLRISQKRGKSEDYKRVRSLLAAHGPKWAHEELGEIADRLRGVWREGFIEMIELDAPTFVSHASDLFSRTPIRAVTITSLEGLSSFRQLLWVPEISRIRALCLSGVGLNDENAKAIAAAPELSKLLWLDLSGNKIDDAGVRALVRSPYLRDLKWLGFQDNLSRLLPRPGGRDWNGMILSTAWSSEMLAMKDRPEWVNQCAEEKHPDWYEVL